MFHYDTELAADSATAAASWAIFWATLVAAVGTIGAVIVALFQPGETLRKRRVANVRIRESIAALRRARSLVDEVWSDVPKNGKSTDDLWAWINRVELHRSLLERFFRDVEDYATITAIATMQQSLFEIRDALRRCAEVEQRTKSVDYAARIRTRDMIETSRNRLGEVGRSAP